MTLNISPSILLRANLTCKSVWFLSFSIVFTIKASQLPFPNHKMLFLTVAFFFSTISLSGGIYPDEKCFQAAKNSICFKYYPLQFKNCVATLSPYYDKVKFIFISIYNKTFNNIKNNFSCNFCILLSNKCSCKH